MSHPSRVRGLKFHDPVGGSSVNLVAPFTGAWIEIKKVLRDYETVRVSHPSRVRGLKFSLSHIKGKAIVVAPFTGAWIEILIRIKSKREV